MTTLLNKCGFVWSPKIKEAFSKLKGAVVKPPVLALPNFLLPFQIECDTSSKAIGTILMQLGHPIAYFSKDLKGKTLILSTYVNELLALVTTVQKWRLYLLGSRFLVKIDHQSLKFLLNQKIGTPMQQK